MMDDTTTPIDDYIAASPPDVQPVLRRIRDIVRSAAPDARETISYRMPAFRGRGMLLYFAAFKTHIGVFPPIHGDEDLETALEPYRGPKGNLRFPLSQAIPFDLIERIAVLRVRQDEAGRTKIRTGRRP